MREGTRVGISARTRRRGLASFVFVCGSLSLWHSAEAALLVNGSFEDGPTDFGGSSFITLAGGSSAIPGWTVTGGTIDYLGSAWLASDGVRSIDLDGAFSTGGVQQSFATAVGETYRVAFDLSGNPEGGPTLKQLRASAGSATQDFTFDPTGLTRGTLTWTSVAFDFVASATTSTLLFSSLSPSGNSWGALIDNVSVARKTTTPVPEPPALALLGLGLLVSTVARRRTLRG